MSDFSAWARMNASVGLAMPPFSEWRRRARAVIQTVLDGLQAGAALDIKEVRRRLREAYPFGERRGWPYKQWLVEQGICMRRLFPDCQTIEKPEVGLSLRSGQWPPFIVPLCGWCGNGHKVQTAGCLVCGPMLDGMYERFKGGEWKQWRDAMRKDPHAGLAFADLLDEQGQDELAELIRQASFAKLEETKDECEQL